MNAPSVIRYHKKAGQGLLQSVDFSTVGEQSIGFFQCSNPSDLDALKRKLSRPEFSQQFVAVTHVEGRPVLIMRSDTRPESTLAALRASGEQLQKFTPTKPFDPWRVRSYLGFGGQTLQMTSAFLRPETRFNTGKGPLRRLDTSIFVFAAANLAANSINFVYDHGQQTEDPNHLRYLKQKLNRELSPHLSQGQTAPSIDDHRVDLRPSNDEHKPFDGAKSFLRHHSVQVGELGLRYLGAAGLAFPARHWLNSFGSGKVPPMDSSKLRVYTGLSSMLGKTISQSSKIPDPYNPKPRTWLDDIREKLTFQAGGWVEVTSFSALAYDCFFNSTGEKNVHRGIQNPFTGTLHRDWLGGIGASLFVLGYIVRSWAKFGERTVDMDELYAHASDTLAQTSPDKLPQLLADTAASLSEHFKNQPHKDFATIYTSLANDLARYHALNLLQESSNAVSTEPTAEARDTAVSPANHSSQTPGTRVATVHPQALASNRQHTPAIS